MATVTIRPNSDIRQSNATKSTGSTFYGCVDEATLDTGDYITLANFGGYAIFNHTSTGLTTETINSVTVYANLDNTYGAGSCVTYDEGHTGAWADTMTQVSGNLYSITYATDPSTGSAWVASDIPTFNAGASPKPDPNYKTTTKIYQFYLVVDYTAGGQTLTLACNAGSYALTGTNVTLTATVRQNLTLACEAGSYSLTGTDATLTVQRNYTLVCEAGSYALTGTNADLTVTRHYTLTCGAGSYALTGTNADITSSRTLVCDSASGGAYPDILVSGAGTSDANGTYSYAGDSYGKPYYENGSNLIVWVDFLGYKQWTISVDGTGVYESTEDVATPDLVTTWTVGVDGTLPVPTVTIATTYVLTGSDVTLTVQRNYTLVCETGSYSLTGSDVSLTVQRNYVLSCESGSYALTGTNVDLTVTRHYTLVCDPGSYALTGTDVGLGNTKSYTLVCEAGSYSLTGTDVSLEVQRNYTLVCETGSYALTGTNVSLVILRNYILACSAGTYSLTGTNAALTSALTMALEAGSYALTGTNADLTVTYSAGGVPKQYLHYARLRSN